MKPIMLALPLVMLTFTPFGMMLFLTWAATGMMCWKVEFVRNLMIGCYIVGGFWYMAASSL